MSLGDDGICPEESAAQSTISPGVVKNEELLARIILKHEDFVGEGAADTFLTIGDLQQNGGWSFARKEYADENRICEIGERLAHQQEGAQYLGYAQVKTADVRDIKDDCGNQAFCVIDDACEDYKEHALITESTKRGKGTAREIRKKLMRLVKPFWR